MEVWRLNRRSSRYPIPPAATVLAVASLITTWGCQSTGPQRQAASAGGAQRSAPAPTRADVSRSPEAYHGRFCFAGQPQGTVSWTMLRNDAYLVAYDETHRNPAWVAYRVPGEMRFTHQDRPTRFATDDRTRARVNHKDYTRTGFDRGHMAPSYAIFSRFGPQAQQQTFVMSNICPQTPNLNRGRWRQLEARVAGHGRGHGGWAQDRKMIWVVTGPLYEGNVPRLDTGVTVPSHFFKILLDEDEATGALNVLTFIMPNVKKVSGELADYLCSVDETERRTGLDFFPELPDRQENALEMNVPRQLWAASPN